MIIEDKKNDNTETSVEETTTPQTGESLFFAKDKTVLADNPLPIEEEKKEINNYIFQIVVFFYFAQFIVFLLMLSS